MPPDPRRARELFHAALDLPAPERPAFLADACAGDSALLHRVQALLAADAGPAPDLDGTAAFPGHAATEAPPADAPPAENDGAGAVVAGRYRLLEAIGEGGMGSVWLAQQAEPVKRLVAVKLIKAGMDSKQVLARFEQERQALAMMDHPNIAKVLDGGIHQGRPFFVMELVKGVPITEFCDARRLTPRQRLELFVPVCQAIQHAHQKGVIHRDVKPSNVLIALYDDRPVPKVIDFGVAKATGAALTEHTLHTGFGGVVGTPQYMSPEQATLNNLDIDTRSDVYSLGVLLYELLAGSPPFLREDLQRAGVLEVLRVVREEEPPRPSAKLSTANAAASLSARRGTEPKKLAGLLRSELDWIVMKALEKDRGRRYDTATGFAADVSRYLAGEPVLAHPPGAAYRARKFLRKHRGPAFAAGLVAAALVLGLAGLTWGLVRANQALAAETKLRELGEAEAAKAAAEVAEKAEEARKAEVAAADGRAKDALKMTITRLSNQNRLSPVSQPDRELLSNIAAQWEAFAQSKGASPEAQLIRAEGAQEIAGLLDAWKLYAEAESERRKAITILETLTVDFPGVEDYLERLSDSIHALAWRLEINAKQKSKVKQAVLLYISLVKVKEKILQLNIADTDRYDSMVAAHRKLGSCLIMAGEREHAEQKFRHIVSLLEQDKSTSFCDKAIGRGYGYIGRLVSDKDPIDFSNDFFEVDYIEYAEPERPFVEMINSNNAKTIASIMWFDKAIIALTPCYEKDLNPSDGGTLRTSHMWRAEAFDRMGQHARALHDWDKVVALYSESLNRGDWLAARLSRAHCRVRTGQINEAIAEAGELVKPTTSLSILGWKESYYLYDIARIYSIASAKDATKQDAYAVRAVELLQLAVAEGYKEAAEASQDADLAPLRGRADFQALLIDMRELAPPPRRVAP